MNQKPSRRNEGKPESELLELSGKIENSTVYHVLLGVIVLIALFCLLPGKKILAMLAAYPLVAGFYLMLFLLFLVAVFYKKPFIYIAIALLLFSSLLFLYLGKDVGLTHGADFIRLFIPIIFLLILSIGAAFLAYAMGKEKVRSKK